MAKIRRVIRKTASAGEGGIENQFWPVMVALFVLGGFLLGMILVYLPRFTWLWPGLIVVPLLVGGVMVGLYLLRHRTLKRSLQLAIVISVFLHLFFVIALAPLIWFWYGPPPMFAQSDELIEEQELVIVPEYFEPVTDQPTQDHEQLVETTTPTTEPDELKKQETEPEQTPQKPQPVPLPETEQTAQPSVIKRQETSKTSPRHSDTAAQLSRQTNESQPRTGQMQAAATQMAQASPSTTSAEAQTSPVERQATDRQVQRRDVSKEPSTEVEKTALEIARRETEQTPTVQSTSAATLTRQMADAQNTPRTNVETTDAPSVSKQTQPNVRPNNTTADKQETASPQIVRQTPQAIVETPTEVAAQPQQRQERAETQPTIAQTSQSADNPAPRLTTRPSVNVPNVELVTPSASPRPSPSQPTPSAQPTRVARSDTPTPQVVRSADNPAPAPTPTTVTASAPRRESQTAPTTNTAAQSATSVARQSTNANPTAAVTAQVANTQSAAANAADSTALNSARPSPTTAAKQAASDTQVGSATATPSPNAPSTSADATPSQISRRQPRADAAPTTAQAAQSFNTPRTSTESQPSAATTASAEATNQAPTASANPAPQPSSATIARQPTSDSSATVSQPASATSAASPTTQVARSTSTRADAAQSPSIVTQAQASNSPSRSVRPAVVAGSPVAVASPAAAQVDQGAANPSAQPARLAVNKSFSGTAGIGRSENLDRGTAAPNSPSLVASDSANRTKATQTAAGPAFAPSEVAQMSRSVAGAEMPSATLAASNVEQADAAGAEQPTQHDASASAGLSQKGSNAETGAVSVSKGNVQVDLGPTRIVTGDAGARASGGGQQRLNFETNAQQIARNDVGGAPLNALATTNVAETAEAPTKQGGGQPAAPQLEIDATATVRSQAGGDQPASGGPSRATAQGPATEINTADQVAAATISRAEAAETAPGLTAAGGGDPNEDEEKKRLRLLGRTATGGGPQLAMTAPTTAAEATSPAGETGGGQPAAPEASVDAGKLAKAEPGGGSPATGGPSATLAEGPDASAGGGEVTANVQMGRTEIVEAAPGRPVIGGGTAAPQRTLSGGSGVPTLVRAENVALAGGPSSGNPDVQPVDAQGTEVTRLAGGSTAAALTGPIGAMRGDPVTAAVSGALPGISLGQRRSSPSTDDGPTVVAVSNAGAPLRRAGAVNLPMGTGAETSVDSPADGPSDAGESGAVSLASAADIGRLSQPAAGGLAVNIDIDPGAGGLGSEEAPDAGIRSPRARRDSLEISPNVDARFARTETGGRLGTTTVAVAPSDAFIDRRPGDGRGGPSRLAPQTEAAIELGLLFLKRTQLPDGSWSLNHFGTDSGELIREDAAMKSDTAATGLALLAFQGAGYTHREFQYADNVRNGLQWLIRQQKEDGDLYLKMDEKSHNAVWLYSHSIAALALCEAYGMTQDPELREPAQKSLDFIVASQNKERGGWRYSPGRGSDMSVSGWMFMALHSGGLAGLEVPADCLQRVRMWLDRAQASSTERHLYAYNPDAAADDPQRSHGRLPSTTMTSVGLLMRLYTGWRRDNEHMIKGAEYLLKNLPLMDSTTNRDTYYWYYATQVMCHMGGDHWKAWNERLHPMLISTQLKRGDLAGSWDAMRPVPDRWGPHAGRLYVTTMNLLSLEVQYRLLPLYEDTVK